MKRIKSLVLVGMLLAVVACQQILPPPSPLKSLSNQKVEDWPAGTSGILEMVYTTRSAVDELGIEQVLMSGSVDDQGKFHLNLIDPAPEWLIPAALFEDGFNCKFNGSISNPAARILSSGNQLRLRSGNKITGITAYAASSRYNGNLGESTYSFLFSNAAFLLKGSSVCKDIFGERIIEYHMNIYPGWNITSSRIDRYQGKVEYVGVYVPTSIPKDLKWWASVPNPNF